MPAQRKPAEKAARPQNGMAALVVLPKLGNAPEMPSSSSGWLPATAKAWDSYWTDAVSGLIQPSETTIVERYFAYIDEWHRAMTAFKTQRLVEGSTGQPRLNPLAAFIKGLEGDISALEMRLGLSPKARGQLGIVIGEAKRSLADLNRELEGQNADVDADEDPRDA